MCIWGENLFLDVRLRERTTTTNVFLSKIALFSNWMLRICWPEMQITRTQIASFGWIS